MARPRAAWTFSLLVLASLLAGCAASSGTGAPASAPPPPPTRSRDFAAAGSVGNIVGHVVDDEVVPLPGVRVILIDREASVQTDEGGAFEFLNLEVGEHALAASKSGYQTATKTVAVTAGVDARVELVMARLPAREPYVEVQLHTTLHHYEASLATWAVHYYAGYFTNNSVGPSCEACMWFVTAPEVPGEMLLEITGTHAVPPPWTTPRETWYSYRVHAIDADASMGYSVTNMPTYIRFANKEIQNSTEYLFTFYCDTVWLCIEERRDAYLSLFYGLDLPEGYTAIPAK